MLKEDARIRVFSFFLLSGILFSPHAPADEACPDGNLLARRLPSIRAGVFQAKRLTDGVAAIEGGDWQVDLVATLQSDATLVYDLEQPVRVRSAFLQGDHPGPYTIEGSADGEGWFELWKTQPADGPGLRSRTTSGLDRSLRFLRVANPRPGRASGLTELQISCNRQDTWPTVAIRAGATDATFAPLRDLYRQQQAMHRLNVGLLGGIAFFSLFLGSRRGKSPPGFWLALSGAMTVLLYATVRAFRQPVDADRWLQFAGVTVAAVALALGAVCTIFARHLRLGDRTLTGDAVPRLRSAAAALGSTRS